MIILYILLIFLLSTIHPTFSIGLCHRNICLNGGTCIVRDDDSFGCRCPLGYGGLICEVSCGCVHGDCDADTRECSCHRGWIGEKCDIEAPHPALLCNKELDCPSDQRCLENENGTKVCMIDPCHENPCRHGGKCTVNKGIQECSCSSAFKGKYCEEDVNECLENPCKNNGECVNKLGTFECICTDSFIGNLCQDIVSDCSSLCGGSCIKTENGFNCICSNGTLLSTPCTPKTKNECGDCMHGGKCAPLTSIKSICLCTPDYEGIACERKQECLVNGLECSNGGTCTHGLGGTFCQCIHSFEGENCQLGPTTTNVPDRCATVTCANGGYCLISNGEPKCACPSHFMGTWCEYPSNTCNDIQCYNGGTCRQIGDDEGSFECICPRGFSGNMCEDTVDSFQSISIPTTADVSPPLTTTTTILPTTTSSPSTTVSSSSTISPSTTVPSTVIPSAQPSTVVVAPETTPEITCSMCINSIRCIETIEGSLCICKDGFKGSTCEETTKSCSSISCISPQECHHNSTLSSSSIYCDCPIGKSGTDCSIISSLSFSKQSLFVHQSPHVMIGSSSGPLKYETSFFFRTTVPDVHIITGEDLFGTRLYSLFIQDGILTMNISSTSYTLLPNLINDGIWYKIEMKKTHKDMIISLSEENGRHLFTRLLPRSSSFDVFSTRLGKISSSQYFVGCISEFMVDGSYHDIVTLPKGVAVTRGCNHRSVCSSSPCQSGICIDLWDSFTCQCPPPLLPPLCISSLPPSTFGHQQPSYAHFSINNHIANTLKYHSSISLLLRTRKSDEVVIVVGERLEKESDSNDLATFLSIEIKNGTLHGRARVGRKAIVDIDSDTKVDDNEEHLVILKREKSKITMEIDGVSRGEAILENRFDYPLFTDSLLIGTANESAHGAFTTNEHFKGSLQDIRVNDLSAVLHQTNIEVKSIGSLLHSYNILEGLVSDDLCSSSPCIHGECSNLFNEYTCSCSIGWNGVNCTQIDHCLHNSCPSQSICYSHDHGYSCSSPSHFIESSFAEFSINNPISIEKIEFSIRTHSERGHIISIGDYSISIVDGRLSFGSVSSPFQLRSKINNGQWHNITIHKNVVKIGNTTHGLLKSATLSLQSISMIRIGSTQSISSFWGCINDIKIEDSIPLSFIPLSIPLNEDWISTKRHRIEGKGCPSVPQCGIADQCMNGAICEDIWNKRLCKCANGFTGEYCENEINECSSIHCINGYCIDRIGEAQCICHPGYTGSSCHIQLDICEEDQVCLNDGICRKSNSSSSSYNCLCVPGYYGRSCALKGESNCDEKSCMNGGKCIGDKNSFSCECMNGYSGEKCEIEPSPCLSNPCGIHGICQRNEQSYSCQCLSGYIGSHCDSISSLCSSSSCSSHGTCHNVINSTLCHCNPPWTGPSCSIQMGGCSLNPCSNDGECIEGPNGDIECKCREYYLGDHCELVGSCLSSPCVNGKCKQNTPTEHICQCNEGYRGDQCQEEIDMCEVSPCANGASCSSSKGKFACTCAPGFDGIRCDHDIDECTSSPCQNGGKCIDRVADFECQCTEQFTGSICENDVDECTLEGKCIHGRCTNTHGSYKCDCSIGYLGTSCSLRDPCIPDSNNRTTHMCVHGDCSHPISRSEGGREWAEHQCNCHPPYTGPTCATKREESRLSLGYVVGPIIAVLIVLSLLGCALLLFVLKGKGALQGHYSPSHQEEQGRYPMGTMLKLPPEERLI